MFPSLLMSGMALAAPVPQAASAVEQMQVSRPAMHLVIVDGRPRWRKTSDGYTWLIYDGDLLSAESGPHHNAKFFYDQHRKLVGIQFDNATSVIAHYGPNARLAALRSCKGKMVRFRDDQAFDVSPTSARAAEFHEAMAMLAPSASQVMSPYRTPGGRALYTYTERKKPAPAN